MHTPGPWTIENSGPQSQGEWHYWVIKGERGHIADVGIDMTGDGLGLISAASQRGPIDMDSNYANAKLIAAAPEMLAALRAIHMDLSQYFACGGQLSRADLVDSIRSAQSRIDAVQKLLCPDPEPNRT